MVKLLHLYIFLFFFVCLFVYFLILSHQYMSLPLLSNNQTQFFLVLSPAPIYQIHRRPFCLNHRRPFCPYHRRTLFYNVFATEILTDLAFADADLFQGGGSVSFSRRWSYERRRRSLMVRRRRQQGGWCWCVMVGQWCEGGKR